MQQEPDGGNGRWRILAQSLIGALLAMILAGMGVIWSRLDRMNETLVMVAANLQAELARRDDLYRRIELLERRLDTHTEAIKR